MCIFILLGCSAVVSTFHDSALSTHTSLLCNPSANVKVTTDKLFQVGCVETWMPGGFVGEKLLLGLSSVNTMFSLGVLKKPKP